MVAATALSMSLRTHRNRLGTNMFLVLKQTSSQNSPHRFFIAIIEPIFFTYKNFLSISHYQSINWDINIINIEAYIYKSTSRLCQPRFPRGFYLCRDTFALNYYFMLTQKPSASWHSRQDMWKLIASSFLAYLELKKFNLLKLQKF